jgi:hypothetical protein
MSCPRKRLPQGSGYVKTPDTVVAKANEDALQKLLAARAAQDTHYFPVDPNPLPARKVAGPGNSSTTMTSDQGNKSPATS